MWKRFSRSCAHFNIPKPDSKQYGNMIFLFSQWLDPLLENSCGYLCLHNHSLPYISLSLSLSLSVTLPPCDSIRSFVSQKVQCQRSNIILADMGINENQFREHFVQEHPGYVIYPLRLNGSAVETIFGWLTGGHLSAVNLLRQLDYSLWCAWSTLHWYLQICSSVCKGAQTK